LQFIHINKGAGQVSYVENRWLRLVLSFALLFGIIIFSTQVGHADPVTQQTSLPALDAEQSGFLTLINTFRAQNGLGTLHVSPTLQKAAQWMSTDMASKNYVSHTDSMGRTPGVRIAAFGYAYSPWGENIAAGYSGAQNTFEQWRNACDPDASGTCTYAHRNNMLNPGFNAIGIGRASGSGSSYGWYWTTDFGGYVDEEVGPTPNPPTASLPAIASFTGVPLSITAGQSATLSWSVTGATSISVDNGLGSVVSTGSRTVSPAQTTKYKLTAANSNGSSTAQVTVVVTALARDTQAPTAPAIVSSGARSERQVDLTWTASTDNVEVAGYQVIRNGSVIASVPAASRSYSDRDVQPATSYTYNLRAYDAASNYSAISNSILIRTPASSESTACPAPATDAFTACYYNNTDLAGSPALVRTDSQIAFNWGTGTPASSIVPYNFSVRWSGYFSFDQGEYEFSTTASDGIRLYIDGQLALNRWRDQPAYLFNVRRNLAQGSHLIVVEYYERTGLSTAHVSWRKVNSPGAQTPVIASFSAIPLVITAGQSTTLSWSVTGATSISLDNGVGNVTGSSSKTLSPSRTSTYKLTATNGNGSVTAAVTVTVNSMARDTQAPTIPAISSAVAKNAAQVDLAWAAATDSVGVAGYQIIRNGSVLSSLAGDSRSFSDPSVSPATSYVYTLKAYDAAGNYSGASNSARVTTPAGPSSSVCPAAATGAFTGCYYNNVDMSGTPALTRTDGKINFNWTTGTPNFEGGDYSFSVTASDGIRLYIDGQLVLNRWRDQPAYRYVIRRGLTPGPHLIKVEYYQRTGSPAALVSWQRAAQ
jgi:uncharacterized protein YkwD/chitodextrinase